MSHSRLYMTMNFNQNCITNLYEINSSKKIIKTVSVGSAFEKQV